MVGLMGAMMEVVDGRHAQGKEGLVKCQELAENFHSAR